MQSQELIELCVRYSYPWHKLSSTPYSQILLIWGRPHTTPLFVVHCTVPTGRINRAFWRTDQTEMLPDKAFGLIQNYLTTVPSNQTQHYTYPAFALAANFIARIPDLADLADLAEEPEES